jgi:protein gp37
MPSLLWVCDMGELFLHPPAILDRVISRLAWPDHVIGLILTKLPERMAAYFNAQPASVQQRWCKKLWLGFSAENQFWFDKRWPHMRDLAQRGWFVFVSVAPMLGPLRLPDDFLVWGKWVIVSGEQGPHKHVRYMSPSWARVVRDRCVAAGVPFFMKQMSGKRPIPPDLQKFLQFPHPE